MNRNLRITGSAGFEPFNPTSIAKGGCQTQPARTIAAPSKAPIRRSEETMRDLQSYGLMEERYGIREEGIF